MNKISDMIIIGSGISGASLSQMLPKSFDTLIIEQSPKPGGLIHCEVVDGILFHKVGGHVFNSKNPQVLNWFQNHFDLENDFFRATRNAKIWLDNKTIDYPIENSIYQLPRDKAISVFSELISIKQKNSILTKTENLKEYLISNFGNELFTLYFGPYNRKIWQMELENIPLNWLHGKLPMPNHDEILLTNLFREAESNMVHSTFFYPKENGSQFIIDTLLHESNILTNTKVEIIETSNNLIKINNQFESNYLVYTGDIRNLSSIVNIKDQELMKTLNELRYLKSNSTTNILCECDRTDLSWLYFPEPQFKAHRIIYTGNFSNANNRPGGRLSCVVEFAGMHNPKDLLLSLQTMPGNLSPVKSNFALNSYIVHGHDTREKIENAKSLLKKYNIFLLGRFAEWEYYNMDKCIESAFTIAEIFN